MSRDVRPPVRESEMPTYLVEAYVARGDARSLADIERRARTAAAELTRSGTAVRHLRSIYVPADETCFYVFEGPSIGVVEDVCVRARLTFNRVTEAVEPVHSKGGAR